MVKRRSSAGVGLWLQAEGTRPTVQSFYCHPSNTDFGYFAYSGLIVHRSLLPLLSFILRAHAAIDSPLPGHMRRRPADLIIQDCLLGLDPLCPQPFSHHKYHSLTGEEAADQLMDESGGGSLIITSRLVMDHIGGAASTTKGTVYEPGKWRCGWRHPFHGREEVDVVVV